MDMVQETGKVPARELEALSRGHSEALAEPIIMAITHIVHRHRKSHRKCRQRTIICAITVMRRHSMC